MGTNYLLSAKFLTGIENRLSSRDTIAKADLPAAIEKKSVTDSQEMISELFAFMDQKDILIALDHEHYITRGLCRYCQSLLEREGAATANEFCDICTSSELSGKAKTSVRQVSNAALRWMVRQKAVEIVNLSERGDVLYVAHNQKSSKMVQHVIDLDEED